MSPSNHSLSCLQLAVLMLLAACEVLDVNGDGPAPADAAVSSAAVRLGAPPSYVGTNGGSSACTRTFKTAGFAPADAGTKHPLFLYLVGTAGSADDRGAQFDAEAPTRVTRAMAERGFVALSVEYDNALASTLTEKMSCLFGPGNPANVLARACAMPAVDCALGIATWGHSQGALFAHAAANYDHRVRAVWTTGYSGFPNDNVPVSRFRAVNGEADPSNGSVESANRTAGFGWGDQCPDDGRDQCLRPDGSGWIIVRKSACKSNTADHCWFNKHSFADNAETLEPSWIDASSTAPFALESNADWVAKTVRRAGP